MRILGEKQEEYRKEVIDTGRELLKKARKEKGMTQQEVADQLGISLVYYQKLEQGSRTGDFEIWDNLEDLFIIHQRELRLLE